MELQQVIKKAVEGGWDANTAYITTNYIEDEKGIDQSSLLSIHKALLDPTFW